MKRAYADIPEGQIHYRFEGTGEPLILLHAAVCSSDEYTRVIPYLSKYFRVIALDFLGAGDSDPSPYPYQIIDHARSVVSFMDAMGIKKAIIGGHHLGATVAAELQIGWPERVSKLLLSALGYRPDPSENIPFKDPPDFTSTVEIKPDGSHLLEWWRRAGLWGDPTDVVHERTIEYIKAGPRGEEEHWAGVPYHPKERLPLISCPALMIFGTKDPFYVTVEGVKKLVPNGKFTIIENGPISIDRVMPKEFAGAMLDFLLPPKKR